MAIGDVTSSSALDQYRSENSSSVQAQTADNALGRDAFLELMVAQLNNQNPLDPQDNQAFVAQLAQFSQVEGLDKLNTTSESMASEFSSYSALQASSLVGQSVIVEGNTTGLLLNGGVVSGYSEVPSSASNMQLSITDASGQVLEQFDLGNHASGPLSIRWDGINLMVDGEIQDIDVSALNRQEYYTDENGDQVLDSNGDPVPIPYDPGEYQFVVTGTVAGQTEQLDMQMSSRVDSVTLSSSGQVTLNLTGGQRASLDQVSQILDE
ncbi:flagellar hook assembly protein FlgD [Parathalassolituus penaei]|uniref:Basal-body rod modification protein FlgD n=1 Tax=Parathalassolituus penaei TaxID=2997323 RepID=A0A9X3IT40_9GAMM|nr:flagellar hook assembly protein FlgD [Parathalassolituus penaei]MCY0965900.1 flagellar hook assembly protein FlgD [Parathalassolituus penaei]